MLAVSPKYAPKHDKESKEAEHMDKCHNAFYEWQFPEKHGVGEDTQE